MYKYIIYFENGDYKTIFANSLTDASFYASDNFEDYDFIKLATFQN